MVVGWVGARAVDRGRGKSTDEEGVCIKHILWGREVDGTKKPRVGEGCTEVGRSGGKKRARENEIKRTNGRARETR